jgi:hypothetical protein
MHLHTLMQVFIKTLNEIIMKTELNFKIVGQNYENIFLILFLLFLYAINGSSDHLKVADDS